MSKEETKDREPATDSEGLLLEYDVVLYGTGLVESIVASALSRAGKSVLHCDGSDHYGALDAVWTLPFVREQAKQEQVKGSDSSAGDRSMIAISSSLMGGLEIHSMNQVQQPQTEQQDETPLYTIATAGTLIKTPYGKARMQQVTAHAEFVRLVLSLSQGAASEENGNLPTLHVSIPWAELLPLEAEKEGKVREPAEWTAEQLQALVDRYYQVQQQTAEQEQQKQADATTKNKTETSPSAPAKEVVFLQSQAQFLDRDILLHRQRFFALDASPGLLLAWGPAVQGLMQSGVADYVEFKSLEQLLYAPAAGGKKGSSSSNSSDKEPTMTLRPVPCSKNDVFSSPLLSPMEKRRLMKFLQLALDYALVLQQQQEEEEWQQQQQREAAIAAAKEGQENEARGTDDSNDDEKTSATTSTSEVEAVTSWNERHLNQGRSLARPQNKAVSTQDMDHLQKCLSGNLAANNDGAAWDFERYLTEHQKLSPSLVSLVRYALALEPILSRTSSASASLERGMQGVCRHMAALGRFGTTAFLVPLHGSGELSQAFCRSAAVYGATYLLRRRLMGIAVNKEKNNKDNESLSVVKGVWMLPPEEPETTQKEQQEEAPAPAAPAAKSNSKHVSCQHVIVSQHLLPSFQPPQHERRVLRRISILRGKPMVERPEQQQRYAIILPPGSVTATAEGRKTNAYAIHGLVLDESVNVAPHLSVNERAGCSVVHLSTVVDVAEKQDATTTTTVDDAILKQALESLLAQRKNPAKDCQEIFHVSFSIPLYEDEPPSTAPTGLHVVRRPAPSLVLDAAFEQAKEIFAKICGPHKEFLVLSKEIETMVKERFGDRPNHDDDEKRVLESAMEMVESKEGEGEGEGGQKEDQPKPESDENTAEAKEHQQDGQQPPKDD